VPPAPPRVSPPSATGTTRIPTPAGAGATSGEAPTTRFAAPAEPPVDAPTTRTPRVDPARAGTPQAPPAVPTPSRRAEPARSNREIESWLGELRGGAPAQPSAEPTRTMPEQRAPQPERDEPTTAIPAQRKQDPESTEKIDTRDVAAEDERKRRGGGMSAADLLRREGRM
jgi:RND superfamily putative drug exporter